MVVSCAVYTSCGPVSEYESAGRGVCKYCMAYESLDHCVRDSCLRHHVSSPSPTRHFDIRLPLSPTPPLLTCVGSTVSHARQGPGQHGGKLPRIADAWRKRLTIVRTGSLLTSSHVVPSLTVAARGRSRPPPRTAGTWCMHDFPQILCRGNKIDSKPAGLQDRLLVA